MTRDLSPVNSYLTSQYFLGLFPNFSTCHHILLLLSSSATKRDFTLVPPPGSSSSTLQATSRFSEWVPTKISPVCLKNKAEHYPLTIPVLKSSLVLSLSTTVDVFTPNTPLNKPCPPVIFVNPLVFQTGFFSPRFHSKALVQAILHRAALVPRLLNVKWKLLSRVQFFEISWTVQAMEFSRPEYWSG